MFVVILIILLIILISFIKNKEYFYNTNYNGINSIYSEDKKKFKSRITDTDYIFIHIPKNAGTSFSNKYCSNQVGHRRANSYNIKYLKKSVAIIRNPYDRLKSCYKYFKMDNNYWSKRYGNPKYHNYCKNNSPNNKNHEGSL